MKETGKVISITEDDVIIEAAPHEECTKCCSCKAAKGGKIAIRKDRAKNLSVGDEVEIEISGASMIQVYILLYAVPLMVFIGTVFVLYFFLHSPVASFAGGVAATITAYIGIGKYIKKKEKFSPEVFIKKI